MHLGFMDLGFRLPAVRCLLRVMTSQSHASPTGPQAFSAGPNFSGATRGGPPAASSSPSPKQRAPTLRGAKDAAQ